MISRRNGTYFVPNVYIIFQCTPIENDSVDGPVKPEKSATNAASNGPITVSSDSNDCSPNKMSRQLGASGNAGESKSKSTSMSAMTGGSAPHSATSSTSKMQTPPAGEGRGGASADAAEASATAGASTKAKRKKKKNKQKRREKAREKRAAALVAAAAIRSSAPGSAKVSESQDADADAKSNRRVSESDSDTDTDASEADTAPSSDKKAAEDSTDAIKSTAPSGGSKMEVDDLAISTLAIDSKKAGSITSPKSASVSTTSGVGSSGTSTSRETTQRGRLLVLLPYCTDSLIYRYTVYCSVIHSILGCCFCVTNKYRRVVNKNVL